MSTTPPIKLSEVPVFIEADTKEVLVMAMLDNNVKFGKKFQYKVLKDGDQWVAWYEHDLELELLNATKGNNG